MSILGRLRRALGGGLGARPQALVDAAVVAIIRDCQVTEVERRNATNLLLSLPWFHELPRHELEAIIDHAIDRLDCRQPHHEVIERLQRKFPEPDARELILGISAFVILSDGVLTPAEADWLERLRVALGFEAARLDELLEDVRDFFEENPEGYPAPPPRDHP